MDKRDISQKQKTKIDFDVLSFSLDKNLVTCKFHLYQK